MPPAFMATTNFSLVLAPLDELDEELDDELEELVELEELEELDDDELDEDELDEELELDELWPPQPLMREAATTNQPHAKRWDSQGDICVFIKLPLNLILLSG